MCAGKTPLVVTALLSTVLAIGATAQTEWAWQGFVLHPPGAYLSEGRGAGDRIAAGFLNPGDDPSMNGPALWRAPRLDLVLLLPPAWPAGWVYGANGEVQVGVVSGINASALALWFGTVQSFVDLSPGDPYFGGTLSDVKWPQQVGRVSLAGNSHAALWYNADPFTFVDLHPAGALRSSALATDGAKQGGLARLSGSNVSTAAMWHGTPGSFVKMHPPVARDSVIWGMAPGVQVGKALIEGILRDHAIVWHDTPESWIDMHPPQHAGKNSYMFATTGTMHVGRSNGRAGYWLGDDPASFYDLHQHLPPGASGSNAEDVAAVGDRIYVVGWATYITRPYAVLWIGTPIAEGGPPDPRAPSKATRWPP